MNKLIFALNISTNIFVLILNSIVNFALAPIFIKKYSVEGYGLISIINTLPQYIMIIISSLQSSFLRYFTIALKKGDIVLAEDHLNSTFNAFFYLNILLLIPLMFFSFNIDHFLTVPVNLKEQAKQLCLLIFITNLLTIQTMPLLVKFITTNKLYIENIIRICARIISLVLLIWLIKMYLNVTAVGYYYLTYTLIIFLMSLYFNHNIMPEVQLKFRKVNISLVKSSLSFSVWVLVNECASVINLTGGIILVNKVLGPEHSGYFAPIMLICSFYILFANAIGRVIIVPIMQSAVSENTINLAIKRAIKFYYFAMSLTVLLFLLCSKNILKLWLGFDFIQIAKPLMVFVFAIWIGGIFHLPSNYYIHGKGKIALPAILHLIFAVIYIVVSFLVIKKTELMGIALAYFVLFGIRAAIQNLIYTYKISKNFAKFNLFYFLLLNICICLVYLLYNVMSNTNGNLHFNFFITLITYFILSLLVLLSKDERILLFNKLKNVFLKW